MAKINIIWIIGIVILLGSIVGIFVSGFFGYDKVENNRYSLSRNFPHELVSLSKKNTFTKIFLYTYASSSLLLVLFVTTSYSKFSDMYLFVLTIAFLSLLLSLLLIILFNIEAKFVKAHILAFSIFAFLLFVFIGTNIIVSNKFLKIANSLDKASGLYISYLLLEIISAVICLIPLFTLKLKDSFKLESVSSDNGNQLRRPKLFPLAFLEWVLIISLLINQIILYVQVI